MLLKQLSTEASMLSISTFISIYVKAVKQLLKSISSKLMANPGSTTNCETLDKLLNLWFSSFTCKMGLMGLLQGMNLLIVSVKHF